ncbi:MAG: hypothetical protein IJ646_05470 [Clostridia bacterium]|nr:hypothetical protein [Clostridia bacterium]
MFMIDGVEWPYPCGIERVAEVRPSEASGLLLDRSYFNDVIGTYMRYTVTVAVPIERRADHSAIYEALTDPVDGHSFLLPYNQGTVEIVGRVESVGDVYVRLPGGGMYWKGLKFTVMANHPTKAMALGEVLARGRTVMPEVMSPEVGARYVWTGTGWEEDD